jgi:hypothetical protein
MAEWKHASQSLDHPGVSHPKLPTNLVFMRGMVAAGRAGRNYFQSNPAIFATPPA